MLVVENKIQEVNKVNENILKCVDYWNREGRSVYDKNIAGELGNSDTQKFARQLSFEDWSLEMIHLDVKNLCKDGLPNTKIIFGKGGSHVWYKENDVRVIMIHNSQN